MFGFLRQRKAADHKRRFSDWIGELLEANDFQDAVAFNFNLYEGRDTFHVELVATSEFDEHDDDWACHEVFASRDNLFIVPRKVAGETWREGLAFCQSLVQEYLDDGELRSVLKSKEAVGIGFVDGNISILRQGGD